MADESVNRSNSNCTASSDGVGDYLSEVEMINSDDFFNTLPPGIRFCPQDSELIVHYLWPKVLNKPLPHNKIFDVNIYLYNPDHLAAMFGKFGEKEWYFFTSRDRKYPNGKRPNRAAGDGYWKATGADRKIFHEGNLVGYRKTLVFYQGRAQQGTKTNWIMHEFRVDHPPARKRNGPADMTLDVFILSRIYKKTEGRASRVEVDPFPLPEQGQEQEEEEQGDDEEMMTEQQQYGNTSHTHTTSPDNNWYSDRPINIGQPLPLPLPLPFYSSSPYTTSQTPFIHSHSHTNTFELNPNPQPLMYPFHDDSNSTETQDYTYTTPHHHQIPPPPPTFFHDDSNSTETQDYTYTTPHHHHQFLPPPPTFPQPKHENSQFPTR